MKIARVVDDTDRENKVANLRKRKFEYNNQGPKSGNPKRFNSGGPQDKKNNWSLSRIEHPAISAVDYTLASPDMTQCDVLDVVKQDIK